MTKQNTLLEREKEAINYALNIANSCESITEFIAILLERLEELNDEQQNTNAF